jgi:hypothetical protein
MPEDDQNKESVTQDKRADILQATFEHYYEMAMDHHTKAGTTSNILLVVVGAIIGLAGLDNSIGGGGNLIGGLAVFVIGVFGAVWVWKQHERYRWWEHIASKYQKELTEIVPGLNTGDTYYEYATVKTKGEFGSLFAKRIDRWLWVSLHLLVACIGVGLIVASIY